VTLILEVPNTDPLKKCRVTKWLGYEMSLSHIPHYFDVKQRTKPIPNSDSDPNPNPKLLS